MIKKYIKFLLTFKICVLHINCSHSLKTENLKFEDYFDYQDYNCINSAGTKFKINVNRGLIKRLEKRNCIISSNNSRLIVNTFINISAQQYFSPKDDTEINSHKILSNMTEDIYIDFLNIALHAMRLEYINSLDPEKLNTLVEYDYTFNCSNEILNRYCSTSIQKILFALSKPDFNSEDWYKLLDIDKIQSEEEKKEEEFTFYKKSSDKYLNQRSKTQHFEKISEINSSIDIDNEYDYLTPRKFIDLRKNGSTFSLNKKNNKTKSESLINSNYNEKVTKSNSINSKSIDLDISFSKKKSNSTLSTKRKLDLYRDKEIIKHQELERTKIKMKEYEKEEYIDMKIKKIVDKKLNSNSKKSTFFYNILNPNNIIGISKNSSHIEMHLHDVKIRIPTNKIK